jgi:hypothetical protein
LEEQYKKKESDPTVKERLLLILKIKYDNTIPSFLPSQVGRELRRSRSWSLNGGGDIFKKARMVLMTSQEVEDLLLNYLKK